METDVAGQIGVNRRRVIITLYVYKYFKMLLLILKKVKFGGFFVHLLLSLLTVCKIKKYEHIFNINLLI